MRCSTNIYLTALAVADIVNLFCAFILSLQHYPSFQYGHVLYWSAFGLSNWFHDASRTYIRNPHCQIPFNYYFDSVVFWQEINQYFITFICMSLCFFLFLFMLVVAF